MKHTYDIQGMTCQGCRNAAEKALNSIDGVTAKVSLNPPVAEIAMDRHIPTEKLQEALSTAGDYRISMHINRTDGKSHAHPEHHHESQVTVKGARYYCPMHCEGEKTYDRPGSCPVCGMNLKKVPQLQHPEKQYTCPMHPEIVKDTPGACPICGMDLVPLAPDDDNQDRTYQVLRRKFWVAVGFTPPIFILAMGEMIPGNPMGNALGQEVSNWIQLAFSLPVVFYSTWMFFQRAWVSFVTLRLNMFSLIGLGAAAAFIFSIIGLLFPGAFPEQFRSHHGGVHLYFEAVTVILTLVLLGQLLEAKAHSRTSGAIRELLKLSPTEAVLVKDGKDTVIHINEIVKGDILRVKPGDKIPVDGTIAEGSGNVDESMITGEPIPVTKKQGDKVSAGTINGTKTFLMSAERVGEETLLAQIIEMVNSASRSRAPIQKLADKVSGYFVPAVIAIAVITFAVWAIYGPDPAYIFAFANALAVLIIACPCALGLATPMSIMVGVGKGAQQGVLIKNAESIEKMAKLHVLITDKTGTITEGKPSVESVVPIAGTAESGMIALISSLNQYSEHPLAKAVLDFAKAKGMAPEKAEDFDAVTGKGVTGIVAGQKAALGNKGLMESVGAAIPTALADEVAREQAKGKTVSYVSRGKSVIGYITISDAIKATSADAIKALQAKGIDVIMLTGDNTATAKAIAAQLGLQHFRAEALPQDKLEEIKKSVAGQSGCYGRGRHQ
jgi:Cu+-exporting ATPase